MLNKNIKSSIEVNKKEIIKEKSVPMGETSNGKMKAASNDKENTNNNQQNVGNNKDNKFTTTVPYAQIDFAKTLALSNSAANHRKL